MYARHRRYNRLAWEQDDFTGRVYTEGIAVEMYLADCAKKQIIPSLEGLMAWIDDGAGDELVGEDTSERN
jgi:hypothetical protein